MILQTVPNSYFNLLSSHYFLIWLLERENNLLFSSEHSPSDTFDLSGCDMIEIPNGVFSQCKNLRKRKLDLSKNRLRDLGSEPLERQDKILEYKLIQPAVRLAAQVSCRESQSRIVGTTVIDQKFLFNPVNQICVNFGHL